MSDHVILVDAEDRPIGMAEKLAAHKAGLLHRAFSVYVFNDRAEMLLQRRNREKYHSGGLWSNACCSHPRPGEETAAAAVRRLDEEMGIRCAVDPAFAFTYRADLGELVEHEYDHVFLARYNGEPSPHPDEVEGVRWASAEDLHREVQEHPGRFTYWFRRSYEKALEAYESGFGSGRNVAGVE